MTTVGNEDHQYVLAMLLPFNMPWSEEEQGVSFWNWVERVFSRDDSWELWCFMGDATGLLQQDEYVTAYPTEANSHPLMKHQDRFDAEPPDTFPYHPSTCVKLILRNVRSLGNDSQQDAVGVGLRPGRWRGPGTARPRPPGMNLRRIYCRAAARLGLGADTGASLSAS